MKNLFKFFGIIAFVAAIGFSMAACDDNSGGGGENGENWSSWRTFTSGQSNQQGGWLISFTGEFTRECHLQR